jgi:glycosyltransferase involved in cell wall biosynthesis
MVAGIASSQAPHVLFVAGEDADLRLPFVRAIRDEGFRVSVAASGGGTAFERAGIRFENFPFDRFIAPASDFGSIRRLGRILDRVQPDLAQGFDTKPCLMLPLAAARRTPLRVRTICGRGWVYSSRSPVALAARLAYRALHGLAARRADATVFQTDSDLRFFMRHGIAGRNAVFIPAGGGGIDPASFDAGMAAGASPRDLRAEFGLGEARVVITVSRLTRAKGIGSLLEAARLVARQRPDVRFLLVGPRESEGPLALTEAELAAHAPTVVTAGPRSDVPALLRMADVFAFPTEYSEGVPRVLLVAALAGVPIVSTSMPGCRTVIEDGVTGRLVPPGDAARMAERLLEALERPAESAAMAARLPARVRRDFTVAAGAARHAALYRSLLTDRSAVAAATGVRPTSPRGAREA